ncbi:MAG: prenyltransferase [Porticoccaceae bacterium]
MVVKILGIIRAPFLLLVPAILAPVFALAWKNNGGIDISLAALVFIAALASHIAVNAFNEYEDFRSGLDFFTQRTAFSGGSGTLVADNRLAPLALYIALIALLTTFSIGAYFLLRLGGQIGSALVVPGLLGLAMIVAYTRWLNRFPLLCLFAPGIGFGLLMVNLGVLVLTGAIGLDSLWLSLPITLLVSNLLLVNQFPDIEADRRVGRRHLAIAWGIRAAAIASIVLMAASYLSIAIGVLFGLLPTLTLLALLTMPLALFVAKKVLAFEVGYTEKLVPGMAANVALTLLTPLLLAVGLVI